MENHDNKGMTLDTIITILKEKHFVIYGNGYVARRLMNQLKRMKCESNVDAVAVTHMLENTVGVNGKSLISIMEIDRNSIVLVAAHDEVAREMVEASCKMKFSKVISIYPYLFELEMGEPIQKNVRIEMDKMIECLHHGYMPAIYYLTVKDYCGERIYNGSLYKKMSEHFITAGAAEKRWERYKRTIEKCKKDGFRQNCNIKVCKDFSLIDGLHRLVLAKYFGVNSLLADMYECDGPFYSKGNIGMDVCIQESDLPKYYTPKEINAIEDIEKTYFN